MGENLDIPGRMAVRSPMQWDTGANAGFSPAQDPARDPVPLGRPLTEGEYSAEAGVNVADQRNDPRSLLSWVQQLARRHRDCPELSWGETRVLDPESAHVLALRSDWEGGTVLVAHNVRDQPAEVTLPLTGEPDGTIAIDLVGDERRHDLDDGSLRLSLEAYDTRWYRVVRPGDRHLL